MRKSFNINGTWLILGLLLCVNLLTGFGADPALSEVAKLAVIVTQVFLWFWLIVQVFVTGFMAFCVCQLAGWVKYAKPVTVNDTKKPKTLDYLLLVGIFAMMFAGYDFGTLSFLLLFFVTATLIMFWTVRKILLG